ncbi:hypothetical protein GCM10029978_108480 [Actinoallomurus acanthiterrae]
MQVGQGKVAGGALEMRDGDDGVRALGAAGAAVGVLRHGDAGQRPDLLDGLADLERDAPVGQRHAPLRMEDDRGRRPGDLGEVRAEQVDGALGLGAGEAVLLDEGAAPDRSEDSGADRDGEPDQDHPPRVAGTEPPQSPQNPRHIPQNSTRSETLQRLQSRSECIYW